MRVKKRRGSRREYVAELRAEAVTDSTGRSFNTVDRVEFEHRSPGLIFRWNRDVVEESGEAA